MPAIIQSSIPSKPTVSGASRNDLRTGDVVTLTAGDLSPTTYAWTLAFAPEDIDGNPSTAALTTPTGVSTQFTVDHEGPYLVRLIVDSGLPSEDVQFVRLRYLTKFGDLKLVAAGERRDGTGVIPVDVDAEGWANEQNQNLQVLQSFIERVSTSGRTLYVDANRGLDNTNPANDPTIAEEYADHSTINAAIAAAQATTPPPALAQPFVVRVKPGYYEEDLALAPHVHVVADGPDSWREDDRAVVVRAQDLAGTNHVADFSNTSDICILRGLTLENGDPTHTHPVLEKEGSGTIYLEKCKVLQNGNGAAQGPCISNIGGHVVCVDSEVISNNTMAADRLAIYLNRASSSFYFDRCTVHGPSAMDINPNNLAGVNCTVLRSKVESSFASAAAYGIQSSADLLKVIWSEFTMTSPGVRAIDVHPLGGAKGTDCIAEIKYCLIPDGVRFNATGVVGTAALRLGATEYGSLSLAGGPTREATVRGDSIFYDNTSTGFAWDNVQDALDQIATILGFLGAGPSYLSLDTAYDGVVDPAANPPVKGVGSGRTIEADGGAVRVVSAMPPAGIPTAGQTDGRLQVESNVEVGGIDAPEINLDPNLYDAGPEIRMGQTVWPDIPTFPQRGLPAATVQATATGSPLWRNYSLRLQTQHSEGGGSIGRLILHAGDALKDGTGPDAGQVYIQSGFADDTTGLPGDIFHCPGYNRNTALEGRNYLARPSQAIRATLTAANPFVGGVSGDISFGIPGVGLVTVRIGAGDNLATVQGKLLAADGIWCSTNPANDPIQVRADAGGPNSEVYFAYDNVSGTLNTALGDFSNAGGAVFVPGEYDHKVAYGCTAIDEFTIWGDLVVTGTITGTFALQYARTVVNSSPYTVLDTDQYLGVDTSIGPVLIYLPDTLPSANEGRVLIIKDEAGQGLANPITIQVGNPLSGLVDGLASLVINSNYGSATMLSNGLANPNTEWFVI
jgi:hypothetical protein